MKHREERKNIRMKKWLAVILAVILAVEPEVVSVMASPQQESISYETEENQKNWDVFLHYLGKDKKFNEFFVDYLIIKNDFLSLYWFLSNLFESSKENDKENNDKNRLSYNTIWNGGV